MIQVTLKLWEPLYFPSLQITFIFQITLQVETALAIGEEGMDQDCAPSTSTSKDQDCAPSTSKDQDCAPTTSKDPVPDVPTVTKTETKVKYM